MLVREFTRALLWEKCSYVHTAHIMIIDVLFLLVYNCLKMSKSVLFRGKYFFLKGCGSKTILHVKYKPSLEVGSKVGVNTRSQKLTACPHKKPSIVSLFLLHPLHASDVFGDSDCVFGQCPPPRHCIQRSPIC